MDLTESGFGTKQKQFNTLGVEHTINSKNNAQHLMSLVAGIASVWRNAEELLIEAVKQ
jgi:hypothetical protein